MKTTVIRPARVAEPTFPALYRGVYTDTDDPTTFWRRVPTRSSTTITQE